MSERKRVELEIANVDDLFKSDEIREDERREKVMDIPLAELHPFRNHPFQVNDNEELRELAKSIRENGVLSPIIARPSENGGYEIISGHRRKAACMIAACDTMPVLVRDIDDDTAVIMMVDSNKQRENLLPSEKAFSYKMRLEAMKRLAGRPSKENASQVGTNLRTDSVLAQETGESRNQIQRYIRLTNLVPELMKMVDEKRIAFNPAVELSYLPKEVQNAIVEAIDTMQCTPSLSQAVRFKKLHIKGELEVGMVFDIMTEPKANQRERVTFPHDRVAKYFPKGYTTMQIENSIIKLLEERQRQRKRSEPER